MECLLSSLRTLDESDARALIDTARLKRQHATLIAIVGLLLAMLRAHGIRLEPDRLPDGSAKKLILRAVKRARRAMPLTHALRVLHITPSRYHAWRARDLSCKLDDLPSCPRSQPARISTPERLTLKTLARSDAFAHMSTRALALFAQRNHLLHVGVNTWHRLIRQHGWRRPRTRIHPRPPTQGLRAQKPGELLHVDVTVIRLLDGSRAYVQAILDNFSRMILAYAVTTAFDGALTASLLRHA